MSPEITIAPLVGVRVVAVFCNGANQWFHLTGHIEGDRLILLQPREGLDPSKASLLSLFTRADIGQNMMAKGELGGRRGDDWLVRVTQPWRPADTRRFPRFRVDSGAMVRDEAGGPQYPGRLIDISAGGAAIETTAPADLCGVEATILDEPFSGTVPARVVAVTPGHGGKNILHLEFGPNVEAYQKAFIRVLVEKAAESHGWIRGR